MDNTNTQISLKDEDSTTEEIGFSSIDVNSPNENPQPSILITPSVNETSPTTNELVSPSGNDGVSHLGHSRIPSTNELVSPTSDLLSSTTNELISPTSDLLSSTTNELVSPTSDLLSSTTNEVSSPSDRFNEGQEDTLLSPESSNNNNNNSASNNNNPSPRLSKSSINEHPLSKSNGEVSNITTTSKSTEKGFGEIQNIESMKAKLVFESVPKTVEGLKQLMEHGCWRGALKLTEDLLEKAKFPHDVLQLKLCRIIAQVSMRIYKTAYDELEQIGNFDDKTNCYEHYPQFYPNKRGSMVPFSLYLLKTELPYYLKQSSSLDPLYEILDLCRKEISHLSSQKDKFDSVQLHNFQLEDSLTSLTPTSTPSFTRKNETIKELFMTPYESTLEKWIQRENQVILTIVTRLLQEKSYLIAIQLLLEYSQKYPQNYNILSSLARVHLQMGNIKTASSLFRQIEKLLPEPEKSTLVHMNRGFLALAQDQYSTAIDHFQNVLNLDPNNLVAANNKAICHLYTCDLTKAISFLEEVIRKDPEKNLNETLIFNLCTLYDLKSDNSVDKKKSIMALVAKFAPDSFDFSVLKLTS